MAVTQTGYAVADIEALKALTGLPASGSGLYYARYVNRMGWYRFDPDATTGGIAPNIGTGRWFPMTGVLDSNTTSERPQNPLNFEERFNTTLGCFEHYANGIWIHRKAGVSSRPLVVAPYTPGATSTVMGMVFVPSLNEVFVMTTSGTLTFFVFSVNDETSAAVNFGVATGLTSLVYCNSNTYIYACATSVLHVVNPTTRTVVTTVTLTGSASVSFGGFLYYSESSNKIYAGRTTGISIVDPNTNTEIAFISPLDPVLSTAMSFDELSPIEIGNFLYLGGTYGSMIKINKTDNSFTVIPMAGAANSNKGQLAFCPSTNKIYMFIATSGGGVMHIFNIATDTFDLPITAPSGGGTTYGRGGMVYCPSTNKIVVMGTYLFTINVQTQVIDFTRRVVGSGSTFLPYFCYFSAIHNMLLFTAIRGLSYIIDPYSLSQTTLGAGHFFLEIPSFKKVFSFASSSNISIVT